MFVKVEITGGSSVIVEGDLLDPGCSIGKEVKDETVEALKRLEENGFLKLTITGEEKVAKAPVVEEVKVEEVPVAVEAPVEVAEEVEVEDKPKKAKKPAKDE